jgi:SOS-response transcriptional repressor LexA
MPRGRKPCREITGKQREILKMIIAFIQRNGYQPSRKDLAHEMGATGHAASQRIWQLQDKGFISADSKAGERCLVLPGLRFVPRIDLSELSAEHRQVLEGILGEISD